MDLADLVPHYVDALIAAIPPLDASHLFLDDAAGRAAVAQLPAYVPPREAMIASCHAYLEACRPSVFVRVPTGAAAQ